MSASDAGEKILTRTEGAVQWLIFNQPEKHNALSLSMTERALEVIEAFGRDDALRVMILAGAGEKAFVSGADISEFDKHRHDAASAHHYHEISNRMFDAVHEVAKPTIALVDGYCFGGGVALAASCDMRYCSDDALFSVPAGILGIGYRPVFTKRVLDLVGPATAKEILFTARRYGPDEAHAMGLVNRVYPKAELEAEVRKIAETIAGNAPLSVKTSKLTINHYLAGPVPYDLSGPDGLVAACSDSEDYAEGRRAFAEKRRPVFKGR